jgi:CHAT domain-containing protein
MASTSRFAARLCNAALRVAVCFSLCASLCVVASAAGQRRAFEDESARVDELRDALTCGSLESVERLALRDADLFPGVVEQLALSVRSESGRAALQARIRAAAAADRSGLLAHHAPRWLAKLDAPLDEELARFEDLSWSAPVDDLAVAIGLHDALAETLERAGWVALAAQHACAALDALDLDRRPEEMACRARDRLAWIEARRVPFEAAQVHERLGHALQVLNQPEEGQRELDRALDTALRRPDSRLALRALHLASLTSSATYGPHVGLELAELSESIAARRGDDDALARALRTQGSMLVMLQDEQRARERSERSIDFAHARGLPEREADSLVYRAKLELRFGRAEAASRALERAAAILEEEPPAAEEDRRRLHRTIQFNCVLEQSRFELVQRDGPLSNERVEQIERVLSVPFDLHDHGMLLLALAEHRVRSGANALAAELACKVIDEARRLGHAEYEARGLVKLADCRAREFEEGIALELLRQALALRDGSRRPQVELSVEGRFERSRTASSDSSFGALIAAQGFERTGSPRFAEEALALIDYGRARTLAARRFPRASASALETPELRRRLDRIAPRSTLVLAFDTRAEVAVAWRAAEARLFRTPPVERLEHLVDFFEHAAWRDPDIDAFAQAAGELSKVLLGPVQQELDEVRELLVVADGPLHRVPFELLLDPRSAPPPRSFADAAYLFRFVEVVHAPCLGRGEAGVARRLARAPQRVVAFGYGGPAQSSRAPLAEHEVATLAALFAPGRRLVRVGAEASEAEFKRVELGPGDVLHIAAHGASGDEGLRSAGLVLAAGEGEDGDLTLQEICARAAPVDLVLLSACNGFVGREVDAEGVLSSAWAFLYAGARAAIVATAPVEDRLGERLFVRVHQRLLEGSGPAKALTLARRELLESDDPLDVAAARLPFLLQQRLP